MKHPVALGCLLLGLAAVPDAMVMPVLHDLSVDRFGVSEGAAHGFMAVNIIGALAFSSYAHRDGFRNFVVDDALF